MSALGLYQQHLRESWFGLFARQLVGFALGVVGLITIYYLFPATEIGRGVFAIALVLGFAAVQGWRVLIARLVDIESLKRRVLVLGAGTHAATIPQRMTISVAFDSLGPDNWSAFIGDAVDERRRNGKPLKALALGLWLRAVGPLIALQELGGANRDTAWGAR